jgi:hypothetical protein
MMLTARQRAEDFLKLWLGENHHTYGAMVGQLTLSFKMHARDQRHLCTEAVIGDIVESAIMNMNTRVPGE